MTKTTLVRATGSRFVVHQPRSKHGIINSRRVNPLPFVHTVGIFRTSWGRRDTAVVRVESISSIGGGHVWCVLDVLWFLGGAGAMYGATRGFPDVHSSSMDGGGDGGVDYNSDVPNQEEESQGDVNTVFHTKDDIWNEAWKPLRDGCPQCAVKGRPVLWLQAIGEQEIGPLVTCAMTELQREITEAGHIDMNISILDDIFANVAGRTARTWLGYTPRMLVTKKAMALAVSQNRYKIIHLKEKLVLYLSVVKLLQSDIISDLFDNMNTSLLPQDHTLGRVRSWSAAAPARENTGQDGLLSISPIVLQDMAICIADIVCAAYIDDVVVGIPSCSLDTSNHTPSPSHLEVSLWPSLLSDSLQSTRDVQNFTNKLYLARFLDEYYYQIVSIYEDRLQLFRFSRQGDSMTIDQARARMRRAHELSNLQGIKYTVSLGIEAFDFISPCIQHIRSLLSRFCMWILGQVIGKGLGYIWEGANAERQKRKKNPKGNRQRGDVQASLQT